MAMLPVVWSQRARRNYAGILEALSEKSLDAALKLDESTEKMIRQISAYPYSFQAADINPRFRRCVIAKHYSAVYEVRDKFVYIVSYLDNRQGG
jgi:plasmid stabilization system protein ParE